MQNAYVPQRTDIVIQQLRDAQLFPDTHAPEYRIDGTPLHGGTVTAGAMLSITNPNPAGTTYYSLDGTDPRLAGGAVTPGADIYVLPVELTHSARVLSRVLDGGERSALSDAVFTVPTAVTSTNLVLTELHFNPAPPSAAELAVNPTFGHDDFEFIELWNRSSLVLDLGGLRFVDGVGFEFPLPSLLAPSGYIVTVRNRQAFETRYGTNVNLAGQYIGSLSDSGETVALHTASGVPVLTFTYGDGFAPLSDGDGPSMVFQGEDYAEAGSWRDSVLIGGTPGRAADIPFRDVVINEVMSHTDPPDLDAIELLNLSTGTVTIGGWWLSDSRKMPRKFSIPGGAALEPGEYAVFDEDDFNPTPLAPATNHFTLNGAHGDDVCLIEPGPGEEPRRIVDTVDFGAAANGETFGRWPDGEGELYPMVSPTLGTTNRGPRVGPIIVSELMVAYPGDTNGYLEFVEIYNPSNVPVPLDNWRIARGANFDFPGTAFLPATGVVVVVSFDPQTNAQRLAEFRAAYGIDETVTLLGPFDGRLDNAGETVRLSRPDDPPLEEPSFYPALLEDETTYAATSPWPLTCQGGGDSLNRLNEYQWGHDPPSWYGAKPSPGTYRSVPLAGFILWQRTAFPYGTPAEDRGWLADANGNGQANALAYAFAFEPLSASNPPTIFTGIASSDGGLDVSYRRRLGATDVLYRVQLSGDFSAWDGSESHVSPVGQPVPFPGDETEVVTFRVDLDAAALTNGHGFVRLHVTRLP